MVSNTDLAAKHRLADQPKSIDIIAAVPEAYRNVLLPLIKSKPVRTASGVCTSQHKVRSLIS